MSAENTVTLLELFRLLTPSEVGRLTETASKKSSNSVSAISFIENTLNADGIIDVSRVTKSAKIIPLDSKVKKKQLEEEIYNDVMEDDSFIEEESTEVADVIEFQSKSPVIEKKIAVGQNIDLDIEVDVNLSKDQKRLESIGIASQNKVAEIEKIRAEQELKNMPSASMFLLEERNKIKKSQTKLYNQKAINMYKNSSNLDLCSSEADEEGEEKSVGTVGVLINKRQY